MKKVDAEMMNVDGNRGTKEVSSWNWNLDRINVRFLIPR